MYISFTSPISSVSILGKWMKTRTITTMVQLLKKKERKFISDYFLQKKHEIPKHFSFMRKLFIYCSSIWLKRHFSVVVAVIVYIFGRLIGWFVCFLNSKMYKTKNFFKILSSSFQIVLHKLKEIAYIRCKRRCIF